MGLLTVLFASICLLLPNVVLAQDDHMAATAGVPLNFTEAQLLANDDVESTAFEIVKWPQAGILEKTGLGTWSYQPPTEPWSHYGYQTDHFAYRTEARRGRSPVVNVDIRLVPSMQLISLNWLPNSGQGKVGWYRSADGSFILCELSTEANPPGGGGSNGAPCQVTPPVGGNAPRIAFVGDWLGGGQDSVGLYDPITGSVERFLLEFHQQEIELQTTGVEPTPWTDGWPIAGDWYGDGFDSVMIWRPEHADMHPADAANEQETLIALPLELLPAGEFQPLVGRFDDSSLDVLTFVYPSAGVLLVLDSSFTSIAMEYNHLRGKSGVQVVGRVFEENVEFTGLFDFSSRVIELHAILPYQVHVLPVTIPDDPD